LGADLAIQEADPVIVVLGPVRVSGRDELGELRLVHRKELRLRDG
jgi:hypothetical protein